MQIFSRMSVPAIVGASIVAGLSFLTGCGSGSDDASAQTTRNQTVTPFIAQSDVQYIDAIVPHHEHVLEMAEMELAKGNRLEVKAIAQTIMDAQMQEITLLKNARHTLTGQAEIPDPHMARDMMRMDEATGANVDAEFLDNMIPHHPEGISIVHCALPNIQRTDVRDNASTVVATQARETGEMQALRR